MTRSGETLLTISVSILVLLLVLEMGNETVALLRSERDADCASLALDRACDRLRKDLDAGAVADGAALVATGVRWEVRDGRLLRNGLAQVALRGATWQPDGQAWMVTLVPTRGVARILRVTPRVPR